MTQEARDCIHRNIFVSGYECAEQYCTLTQEDIRDILQLNFEVNLEGVKSGNVIAEEERLREVLRRFNESRKQKEN